MLITVLVAVKFAICQHVKCFGGVGARLVAVKPARLVRLSWGFVSGGRLRRGSRASPKLCIAAHHSQLHS